LESELEASEGREMERVGGAIEDIIVGAEVSWCSRLGGTHPKPSLDAKAMVGNPVTVKKLGISFRKGGVFGMEGHGS
jgi:hypothetical protein